MQSHPVLFLSRMEPFTRLPEPLLQDSLPFVSRSHYFANMTLFVQNKTLLSHLYIVLAGSIEQFILQDGDKTLYSEISDGSVYGGISLLFNHGISLFTVNTLEDTVFYCLEAQRFLELCSLSPEFSAFFVDTFRMSTNQRSFLTQIAKKAAEDTIHRDIPERGELVSSVYTPHFTECRSDTTVREATRSMSSREEDFILVRSPAGEYSGIVTDEDIRSKVVAAGLHSDETVQRVMTSPLESVSLYADIYEASRRMSERGISHLAVRDDSGRVIGVLTEQGVLSGQWASPAHLSRKLRSAVSVEEIAARRKQLPFLIRSLLESGARAEHLNPFITAFTDIILKRLLDFAQQQLGTPPARFAFMVLGSEGRKEQTLKTDQDNAIVFEDVPPDRENAVQDYFLRLARLVCGWLDQAGYTYCDFDIMAQNPQWCQPLQVWKDYFRGWIEESTPEDILQSCIFFDFRLGYGDWELVRGLRDTLFATLDPQGKFFRHLARTTLQVNPPLDFFGNFILHGEKDGKRALDLKPPMRLIVDMARIYGLHNRIRETNTLQRLVRLEELGALPWSESRELQQAYALMMDLRLSEQARVVLEEGRDPLNSIFPKELGHIQKQSLKASFKSLQKVQERLQAEFLGGYVG